MPSGTAGGPPNPPLRVTGPLPSAALTLERPRSVDDALALLSTSDDPRILAGGQSLVPLLTLGFAAPEVVVSLDRCEGLDALTFGESVVAVGAAVTTRRIELDATLADRCPLLVAAAGKVGSPHVRNFGTLVGNLCHADPGSDLIPAALCLDADVEVQSSRGSRRLAVDELVAAPFVTSLQADELVTNVRVPVPAGAWRHGYRKLALRAGDLAVATAAVLLRLDGDTVTEARLAVGGALRRAVRIRRLEAALAGATVGDAAGVALATDWLDAVADDLLADPATPPDYLHAMLPRFLAAAVRDAATDTA